MSSAGDLLLEGKTKDLGGFQVTRLLPQAHRRSLGPIVFLDHMGPPKIDSKHKLDVRPHPHIGLATVTYLFQGRGLHRDSLGSKQLIEPGDINWMTAGKGIVHSERTPLEDQVGGQTIHGTQFWIALPKQFEECEPEFLHYSKNQFPQVQMSKSVTVKVLIGSLGGHSSPVKVYSPTLFLDFHCSGSDTFDLDLLGQDVGFFWLQGDCAVNGATLIKNTLLIPANSRKISISCQAGARFLIFGGEALPEPRFMWWNFVSTRKERIRQAASDWENQTMGQVPQESEWIPLPQDPLP
jgi:redox-sensitive bicupin YhaK (pirin superfamily)